MNHSIETVLDSSGRLVFPAGLPALSLLVLGTGLALAHMALFWRLHLPGPRRPLANAAWADVGWASGSGMLALLYAALGPAPWPRRVFLALLAAGWSGRLALHLYRDRVAGGREEDHRYEDLRAGWGARAPRCFLWFFLAQGLLVGLLSPPFLLIAFDPDPRFGAWDLAGLALWGVALCGETLADRQLRRFKADPANRRKVCRVGLWGWSRHPNYFFEWLNWVAFALVASTAPWGLLAWLSPALLLFFLLRVTGIPVSERHSLARRGADYERYRREVSAFIPWKPKRTGA